MQGFTAYLPQELFGVSRTIRHLGFAVLVTQELPVFHLALLTVDVFRNQVDVQVFPCLQHFLCLLAGIVGEQFYRFRLGQHGYFVIQCNYLGIELLFPG